VHGIPENVLDHIPSGVDHSGGNLGMLIRGSLKTIAPFVMLSTSSLLCKDGGEYNGKKYVAD
jgi:hypothetical protein